MKNEDIIKMLHDLNNVLCACSGYTEMLLEAEDREYQKKLLGVTRGGMIKMGSLLETTRIKLLKEIEGNSVT